MPPPPASAPSNSWPPDPPPPPPQSTRHEMRVRRPRNPHFPASRRGARPGWVGPRASEWACRVQAERGFGFPRRPDAVDQPVGGTRTHRARPAAAPERSAVSPLTVPSTRREVRVRDPSYTHSLATRRGWPRAGCAGCAGYRLNFGSLQRAARIPPLSLSAGPDAQLPQPPTPAQPRRRLAKNGRSGDPDSRSLWRLDGDRRRRPATETGDGDRRRRPATETGDGDRRRVRPRARRRSGRAASRAPRRRRRRSSAAGSGRSRGRRGGTTRGTAPSG
ncbi:hypothetical protein QE411_002053 [Microbacterium arborescens]|nr:hypothetical protein [Microbacterium arborescens]